MLSIENPPPDPLCSCQLTQQLNATHSDERASHKPLPALDLLKPPLDHLPKFSIRDYVFTSRSKDIKKNWPFSLKNLQLCLKHGVKEVLPPFQDLGSVKTQSIQKCTVETCSLDQRKSTSNSDAAEPCELNNKEVQDSSGDAQLNDKIENACIDTISCRSGGENDFPSTTSVSQSEIESVPGERPSTLQLETDHTFLEASVSASASASATVEVGASGNPATHKTENTTRPPGKKCRLIVKFSGNSDRSSTEDIASNSTAVSETMASKVCPVCKTFTSSSNTTLNAHIDQCLSAESTPKWTVDSRPTRHRIKPRKTRLMVDIYATAKRCTLEELDRRNGTSWAAVSSFPTQDTEQLDQMPTESKRQRVSQVHPEDAGDVGEVYIDANGTKVRILSKSNDAPPSAPKEVEDFQPKDSLKGGKGSKLLSTKRRKRRIKKNLNYLKFASQSRKLLSHKTQASQICGDEEGDFGLEESGEKEKHQKIKSGDSGTLRQWVCSKRRGPTKKVDNQDNRQRCKWHLPQDLQIDSDRSSLGDSPVERNRIQKYANLSENLLPSPAINERVEKPFYENQGSEKWELSSGRKRVGSPLLGAKVSDNMERPRPPMQNGNRLSRDSSIIHGSHTFESSNSNRNWSSSLTKKKDGVNGSPVNDFDDMPPHASAKPCMNTQAFASEALKPVLRKSRSSVFKSKSNRDEECPARKKTRLDPVGNKDKVVAAWRSNVDQQYLLVCNDIENVGRKKINEELPFGSATVRGMRHNRGAVSTSEGEEAIALESLEQAPQCHGHDEGENTDSSARAGDGHIDNVDVLESVEDTVTMGKSVDTKFQQLSNHSNIQSNSLHSMEDYNGILRGRTEASFVDGQDMYSSDEVGNGIIGQSSHMGPDLDSDIRQGNSFPEVDPIPIPGPPGSFLPSPRDMGSDDFQGNSSLTTSRVQSSQDQLDLVDGDSSDSPISAASTISNSTAARSDLKYSEPLSSVGAHAIQDKTKSGFSDAGIDALVGNAAVVSQIRIGAEKSYLDGEKHRVSKISVEKRTLNFKNDGQPCCCQKRERISQDVAPNYQESQLLRRRTMASETVIAMPKPNARPKNLDVKPEIFSLNGCPSFVSDKVVLPVMKSTAESIPVKGSPEAGVKILRSDCDTPSPSTPNPVLRLMGKNLMVVNKEEDATVPLEQSQTRTQNGHAITQFPTSSRVSSGNIQNVDCRSFPHMVPQGPLIFSHHPYDAVGQPFDVRLSSSFRNQTNPRTPQTASQVSAGMFSNQHVNSGFGASMEPHMYEDAYSLSSRHDRSKIRLSETSSYHMGNLVSTLNRPHRNADCGTSIKEVIVIDDTPDEANVSADVTKYSEGLRASHLTSSGTPIPTVPNFNSRHVNSFSCYQSQEHLVLGESPVVHYSNFHAYPSRLPNASPVRWDCTPEGSGKLQRGPFTASSTSSTAHVRSGPYYSPSLS